LRLDIISNFLYRENHEHTKLYPEFVAIAKEEGFPQIATAFRSIALVEKHHEVRFRKLHKNMEEGTVFKKKKVVKWKCRICGYIHEGKTPPAKCPACEHPDSHFEVLEESVE
jgi:rubrerythrin